MTIRENAYSTNGWNLLSTFLCNEVMALLISSPIVLAATWGNMRYTVYTFAGVGVVVMPVCLLLAWSHNRYLQKRGGFVELENDTLHYYENENESPVYSAPFAECLWFVGYRTWATLPRQDNKTVVFQIAIGPQLILLQFPEWLCIPEHRSGKATIAEQPVIVAVGQSQETHEQWAFALENTGVPCDTSRHRRWLAPISSGLVMCWLLFYGIVAFLKLPEAARETTRILNARNVPADVADAIGFTVFVPGIIVLLFWICVFPLAWVNNQTIKRTAKADTKWVALLRFGWFFTVLVVFPWLDIKTTFEWKMAYTISTVTMFVVTSVCYWLLMRKSTCKESDNNE